MMISDSRAYSMTHVRIIMCNVYTQVDESGIVDRSIYFIKCVDTWAISILVFVLLE